MNEPLQQAGSEVSIVIYDAPLPPRYFRFSKKFLRTLFVVVPVSLTLLLTSLFLWGLASRIQQTPVPTLPTVITERDPQIVALETEAKMLKQSNDELMNKLNAQPGIPATDDPHLLVIKKPYGMQNLLNQNKVSLDQFDFVQETNKITLKFQIISNNPENKVTGHVLVFMHSEGGLLTYPKEANAHLDQGVKFSEGEPFAVSRLRPTNAEFFTHLSGDKVKFIIYIFSREGDLLLIKETESFKVGAKQ